MWGGKTPHGLIDDAEDVLELLRLLFTTLLASVRPRQNLVLENLLLRHQVAVLTRPTRTRPRAQLRTWDKLLWILARQWCAGWREHLAFVTPDTRCALASRGLALVLAVEVPLSRRPSSSQSRGAGPDRDHVARQPTVGYRAD